MSDLMITGMVPLTLAEVGSFRSSLPIGILAHGDPTAPHHIWSAWPNSPGVVAALLIAASAWIIAHRRAGRPGGQGWWWAGLVVLGLALLTPLHSLGDSLLSFHMVQHITLGMIAPLMLTRARPMRVLAHLFRTETRRDLGRFGARMRRLPGFAGVIVLIHVAAWWTWHIPVLYDAAITDDLVHSLEHLTLFVAGLLLFGFAWPAGPVRRHGGVGLFMVFTAALGTGALSALITFSPNVLYAHDTEAVAAWGMTRLEDQQLGGAIMWVPGGFVYLGVAVALFARWLTGRPARDPGLTGDHIVLGDH